MPRVIVFDVNETLLDLRALDPLFTEALGEPGARREWFGTLLRAAFTATITDRYRPFGELARDALRAVADARGVWPDEPGLERIVAAMGELPPHADAHPALARLADAGLRLAALTNSAPAVAERQLRGAGLRDRFEAVLSVDAVRRFKPAPEPYLFAAGALGAEPSRLRMVAAHDWDLHGARAAGLEVAYVARPGGTFTPPEARPAVWAPDLESLAERIVAAERP